MGHGGGSPRPRVGRGPRAAGGPPVRVQVQVLRDECAGASEALDRALMALQEGEVDEETALAQLEEAQSRLEGAEALLEEAEHSALLEEDDPDSAQDEEEELDVEATTDAEATDAEAGKAEETLMYVQMAEECEEAGLGEQAPSRHTDASVRREYRQWIRDGADFEESENVIVALVLRMRTEAEQSGVEKAARRKAAVRALDRWKLAGGRISAAERAERVLASRDILECWVHGRPLSLTNFGALTSLPDMHAEGTVRIQRCGELKALPRITAVKSVYVSDCAALSALSRGTTVHGHLHLWRLPRLPQLPLQLRVDWDLRIVECARLGKLSSDMSVGGSLAVRHCGLVELARGMRVGLDVDLRGCARLESLPRGFSVEKGLTLSGCTGLTSLPRGLRVGAGLNLSGCTGLRSLPAQLQVDSTLRISGCTGLVELPSDMRVRMSIEAGGCTALRRLPGGLEVSHDLVVSGCRSLQALPGDMVVGHDLDCRGCSALSTLPATATVRGSINASHCAGITSLPQGFAVADSLSLQHCTALTELPPGLRVGRSLNVEFCAALTRLPDDVLEWGPAADGRPHDIFLSRSGLPPEELARLQQLRNRALRFHAAIDDDLPEDVARRDNPDYLLSFLGSGDFAAVGSAAAFWGAQGARHALVLELTPALEAAVAPAYRRGVLHFLSKLRRAKEFENAEMRTGLARRVVEVLQLLAGDDADVSQELLVQMADSVDTCGDKPVWALNQMSLHVAVARARGDRAALRKLGRGVMHLEVVHEHVRQAIAGMSFVDDVCVYLAFEIQLRDKLDLPVSAEAMLYPSYITIDPKAVSRAKADALRRSKRGFAQWLPEWAEWQRQDRLEFAQALQYKDIRCNSLRRLSLSLCSLMGDPVQDPIRLRPVAATWSLADFLAHWVSSGMDLNNTPRNLEYVKLNLTRSLAL